MARVTVRDNYRLGLILTLSGVLVFSPDGLMLRLIGADGLTLTVWRGVLAGIVILLGSALVYRRDLWRILRAGGWIGLLLVALNAASLLAFNMAITNTSVANVLVTFAIMPLLAALMAWAFLGERLRRDTAVALFFTLLGMLIVTAGATGDGGMRGLVYAILNSVVIAGFFVAVRHLRGQSAIPFVGVGYLVVGLATLAVRFLAGSYRHPVRTAGGERHGSATACHCTGQPGPALSARSRSGPDHAAWRRFSGRSSSGLFLPKTRAPTRWPVAQSSS